MSDPVQRRPKKIPSEVVKTIVNPIEQFIALESSSGILLVLVTIVALILANSPLHHFYHTIIDFPLSLGVGNLVQTHSLHHWVNDGLMVIFFFLVGLEIKRELVIGELSSPKKAALPMVAALGGMLAPALIYFLMNQSGEGLSGWGIPMATDIAFAVGVITLLNRKVPFALKVFLLALAIVDDLGAVLVIALFYTEQIVGEALATATLCFFIALFLKYAGVRSFVPYVAIGIVAWFAVLSSGVHATVAGVILGLMTPVTPYFDIRQLTERFKDSVTKISDRVKGMTPDQKYIDHEATAQINQLKGMMDESLSPLQRLEHALHPWVSFVIMPLFAFCNAGVEIGSIQVVDFLTNTVAIGVTFGLAIGKPLGILTFSWIAVRLGLADLPQGVNWRHMIAVGCLAGIGFTMALFISHLALQNAHGLETYSKLGILLGSTLSALCGVAIFISGPDANQPSQTLPKSD